MDPFVRMVELLATHTKASAIDVLAYSAGAQIVSPGLAKLGTSRPGESREQLRQRWQNMTPDERQRARDRAEHFKQLPPEEQARLREEFRRYRDLPPEQREEARKERKQGKSKDRAEQDERVDGERGRGRDR